MTGATPGPLEREWRRRGYWVKPVRGLRQPDLVAIGDWFACAFVPAEAAGADREVLFRCSIHDLELRRGGWRGLAARLTSWGL